MASAYKQAAGHARPAGLHRRAVRRAGQGLLPDRHEPRRGAQGDQRRASWPSCSGSRSPRCSTAGSTSIIPKCTTDADRRASSTSSTPIGVRSMFPIHKFDNALGGTPLRLRRDRRARQHRQQVRDRQVLDGRALRRPRTTTTSRPTRPATTRRPSTSCSARCWYAAAVRGPAAGLSARAALQPQGPDPARRVPDPGDDAPGHDHRDRPHEREGARRQTLDILEPTKLPRRDLEPQLGRPREPEAHREARRPGRPDLERGDHSSPTSGASLGPTATRSSPSGRRSARTSTGCTPSRCRARAPR